MKPGLSLTARLAFLFALMAFGLLVLVALFIDRSVSAHFDELDLYDLSAKRVQLETIMGQVDSEDDLALLPQRIENAFVGRETVALIISIPQLSWQYALNEAKIDQMQESLLTTQNDFIKWQTEEGVRFIGQMARLQADALYPSDIKLFIGLNISHHVHFLDELRLFLGIGIIGASVLAGMLGWLAAHKGLEPMRKVASTARQLSANQLGKRLSTDDAPAEMQALVEAFNGMLERLEASFRRLNEFSDDIAHELRSPVSNLITETQVALSQARSADQYRDVLHSNLEEFDRLARMIADMLFLAKTDNGLLPAPLQQVKLEQEIVALYEFYEALAEEKQLHLMLNGQGWVMGDSLMLRRALSNLISNAIRHSPAGEQILISITSTKNSLCIEVSNCGEPIPLDQQSRIFERFYRVDPARSRQGDGSGLGLSITRSIIEAHKGEISVKSTDAITQFKITIPKHPVN